MKKKWMSLLVAGIMAGSLAACGGGQDGAKEEVPGEAKAESREEAKTEGEKTLSLLGFLKPGGDSPREKGAGELLKTFTEKTGYGLTSEIVGWEQVEPKLLVSVESGNPPDVTFVRMQSLSIEANADALMPLDEFIERDFDEATKADFLMWDEIGTFNGKNMRFPCRLFLTACT